MSFFQAVSSLNSMGPMPCPVDAVEGSWHGINHRLLIADLFSSSGSGDFSFGWKIKKGHLFLSGPFCLLHSPAV